MHRQRTDAYARRGVRPSCPRSAHGRVALVSSCNLSIRPKSDNVLLGSRFDSFPGARKARRITKVSPALTSNSLPPTSETIKFHSSLRQYSHSPYWIYHLPGVERQVSQYMRSRPAMFHVVNSGDPAISLSAGGIREATQRPQAKRMLRNHLGRRDDRRCAGSVPRKVFIRESVPMAEVQRFISARKRNRLKNRKLRSGAFAVGLGCPDHTRSMVGRTQRRWENRWS